MRLPGRASTTGRTATSPARISNCPLSLASTTSTSMPPYSTTKTQVNALASLNETSAQTPTRDLTTFAAACISCHDSVSGCEPHGHPGRHDPGSRATFATNMATPPKARHARLARHRQSRDIAVKHNKVSAGAGSPCSVELSWKQLTRMAEAHPGYFFMYSGL